MPNVKMLAPNTTLTWVPKAGLTNYAVPTVAQLNAGVNISCAVVTGYTLNPTDSPTDDSSSICDNANVDTFTSDQYEANLTFFRSDLTTPTALFVTVFNLFKKAGASGYLVERHGKGNAAVYAIGDEVSVYGVESDWPQNVFTDENGGPIEYTVPFIPSGEMKLNFTLAA